jgi:signal transduction histidine kinase
MSRTAGSGRLRLHHRIAIPFAIIAFLTTSALAAVALSLINRSLEARVLTQVRSTANVVARADFAFNTAILRTVKEITGADVITCTDDGTVVASTVAPSEASVLLGSIGGKSALASVLHEVSSESIVERRTCGSVPCYIALAPVTSRPSTVVAAIVRTDDVQRASRAIARALIASTAVALFVMILVSQAVARRVTTPIERLVEFTRAATPGTSRARAPTGSDEVGRLAAAFNDMLDRLERAQEALVNSEKLAVAGLLAARVAHDIRNPLSSIKMQAQLLRAQSTTDGNRELATAVLHDVDQVESVIRGLLELARPGELRRENASINEIIGQLLQRLAPQLAHRKLDVVTEFGAPIPAVALDASRFEQAILNVILNAADAMPYGGTLHVATRVDTSDVIIDICDDGIGIDPSVVDRVFDPFVSTKRDGVGLGLVNTKAIIERHGGTIALTPRLPRGTAVHISLPITQSVSTSSAV